MAIFKPGKTEDEIRHTLIAPLRDYAVSITEDYNRLMNHEYVICSKCGKPVKRDFYYKVKNNGTGVYHMCKDCTIARVEQRNKKNDLPNETKESVQEVLREMNFPYIDSLYETACQKLEDEGEDSYRGTPFRRYIAMISSLPQYAKLTWSDSEFGDGLGSIDEEEIKISQKTLKAAKKRFGSGYSAEDYMFLENQYQDWISRYECQTKAQEEIFERLSFKKWEINKATKNGDNTKDLDKTYQDLLSTANIAPRQNSMDTMSDAQTMGTLLQKYEETRPLPDIDPELKDVDKIGLYFDVFFRGHASKMLGLKNTFSHIYEKFMKRYTVSKPEYSEDEDSEVVFEKVFGTSLDE